MNILFKQFNNFLNVECLEKMDKDVLERIARIEERLNALEKVVTLVDRTPQTGAFSSIKMEELLDLPSSLQKTILTLQNLKEATASEVASRLDVRGVLRIFT